MCMASWVLSAILVPENAVFVAFQQYQRARRLATELSELKAHHAVRLSSISDATKIDGQANPETTPHVEKSYSIVFGFYILMGGLAIDVSPLHDRLKVILLTPNAVLHLARKGHFINVSDEDIKDKSKANLLAKSLVLLQITWTMLQCLSRKAAGLPITVLEVHTLVHAACALVMYTTWFKKPMDVEEPTIVSTVGFESEIALMLMRNHRHGVQPLGNLVLPAEFKSARYAGPRYRDWPGFQASEASYLVFNPNWNKGDNPSPGMSHSAPTHPMGSHHGVQGIRVPEGDLTTNDHHSNSPHIIGYEGQPPVLAVANIDTSMPYGNASAIESPPSGNNQQQGMEAPTDGYYKGSRLKKFIAPTVYQRSKAAHERKSSRLFNNTSADSDILKARGVWSGFHSYPPREVSSQLSICTGEVAPGGIGPNAFMVGNWIGDTSLEEQHQAPTIVQVSEALKQRLPLQRINPSSVAAYCPLKISLSQKDLLRWQLAGSALRTEFPPSSVDSRHEDQLIDFSGYGGSLKDVYFVTVQVVSMNKMFEERVAVRSAGKDWAFIVLQGFYNRYLPVIKRFHWNPRAIAAIIVFAPTAFLYAAIHLALWNYTFPTPVERTLWRVSATTLLAIPMLALVPALIIYAYQQIRESRLRETKHADNGTNLESNVPLSSDPPQYDEDGFSYPTKTKLVLIIGVVLVFYLVVALYLFSRIFIIVESFLSLRHVPKGVYVDIGWPKYIPHL
ncbi:MAG: hypothetical protein Q9170_002171 [Blastenia crenularia]